MCESANRHHYRCIVSLYLSFFFPYRFRTDQHVMYDRLYCLNPTSIDKMGWEAVAQSWFNIP